MHCAVQGPGLIRAVRDGKDVNLNALKMDVSRVFIPELFHFTGCYCRHHCALFYVYCFMGGSCRAVTFGKVINLNALNMGVSV